MSDRLQIIAAPHPFLTERLNSIVEAGGSLADVLDRSGLKFPASISARICVNDLVIPKEELETFIPRPGDIITLRAIPRGGGGGKNVLRVVMALAVIAAAPYAGWYAGVAAEGMGMGSMAEGVAFAAKVGFTIGGLLLTNALIPVQPRDNSAASSSTSQSYGIENGSNQTNRWGPIPSILGIHKFYPLYAANPYTEINGDDQYLHCLFCIGYATLDVSDLKIGDTAIDEYKVGDDPEDRLSYEIWPNFNPETDKLKYFKVHCTEATVGIELKQADGWQTRTTELDTEEISIDIQAPNGIVAYDISANKCSYAVDFAIEYRLHGSSGDWSTGTGGQAFSQRAVTIDKPGPAAHYSYNYQDRTGTFDVVTGYSYTIIGIDKTNGAISTYSSNKSSAIGQKATAQDAKAACPAPPSYVAPVCGVYRNSDKSYIDSSDIEDLRTSELDRAQTTDFAASANDTNDVTIASGTLYFRPQVNGKTTSAIRRTYRFAVSKGQYDVRVQRVTADTDDDKIIDTIYWSVMRSIKSTDPVKFWNPATLSGLTLVEMRVKASDTLNGTISNFSCIASSILPDWDATSHTWITRITNNPASLFRAVFQGPANKRPKADSKLNLTEIQAWHEECFARGYTFNQVIDTQSSVRETAINIASGGRAALTYKDGKFSIIEDKAKTNIIQHFTPENSRNFKSTKTLVDLPHAFRVTFADETADWQSSDRLVYRDGYDETNATIIEEMSLAGCTSYELAWIRGRYHLAQLILRPEEFQFETDIENLVCTRGDLVRVTHDVPMWGLGSGRIKSIGPNYLKNSSFKTFSRSPHNLPDFWMMLLNGDGGYVGTVDKCIDSSMDAGSSVKITNPVTATYLIQHLGQNYSSNLVKNGDLELGNCTGFEPYLASLIYEETDTFLGKGCMKFTPLSGAASFFSEEYLEINTSKSFLIGAALKATLAATRAYTGIICYDANKVHIESCRSFRYQGANTTLYANAPQGATYCDIVPASIAWDGSTNGYIQFGILEDGSDLPFPNAQICRIGSIDISNPSYWRVYFYSGVTCPAAFSAGTKVGNSSSTGGYNYAGFIGHKVTTSWTYAEGVIDGISALYEVPINEKLRYGTKYIRFISMPSYQTTDTVYIDNISIKEFDNPVPLLRGSTLYVGAWVWCDKASSAYISLLDGEAGAVSAYHTGNSTWQWLTCSMTISSGSFNACVLLRINSIGSTARFSGVIATDGIDTIDLDDTMTMESGKSYGVRIRRADGSSITAPVITDEGDTTSLSLSSPIPIANAPGKGDLVMFGITGNESVELIIKSIKPSSDLSATITAVDYSPDIFNADSGTIPAYDTHISLPASSYAPIVSSVRSDEKVMVRRPDGSWATRILVTFSLSSNRDMHNIASMEGQYKVAGSAGSWIKLPILNKDAAEASMYDVEVGITYNIRFRYNYISGKTGPWCSTIAHTVIGKSSPPSDVAFDDANCVFQSNRITFVWLAVSDPDLDFYELRSDTNWGLSEGLITRTKSTRFIYANPLDINATYYIKARDTSGNYSNNADSLTGSTDYLTVGTVSSDFSTNDLEIYWAAVDPDKLKYYTLALYSDSAMTTCIYSSDQFTQCHFSFTLAMNQATNGGPYREVWIRVTAHDIYGRTGYSDGYAINAAPAVITSLVVTAILNGLIMYCTPLYGDIIGYEFSCGTTNPPSPSKEGMQSLITWGGLTGGTLYYVRVRARDAFGYGSWSSVISSTPLSLTVDETDLDVPITRDCTWSCSSGTLSWNAHKIVWRGTSYNISAGSTKDAFVYWVSSNPRAYSHGSSVPISLNTWVMCYQSANVAWPAQQSKIIHGGLIQATTVTLGKLLGTGSLDIVSGGSITISAASGLTIASGGDLIVDSGGDIIIENGGNFTINSGGKITINAKTGIEIKDGADMTINVGGSLKVVGDVSNPGSIKIYKTTLNSTFVTLGGYGSGGFRFIPSTADTENLYFAVSGASWANIYGYAASFISWYSGDGLALYAAGSTGLVLYCPDGDLKILGNLRTDSSTNISRIFTGTYTGNGSTSRSLTGVGFTPKAIWIQAVQGTSGDQTHVWITAGKYSIGGLMCATYHAGYTEHTYTGYIKSFNSDGFSIGVGTDGNGPNITNQMYEVICLG